MFYALTFPTIDPVLVSIGPLVVRWYALAYIAGLLLGWILLRRIARTMREVARTDSIIPTQEAVDGLITWVMLGVVVGGRLGYVLFYNPSYYAEYPLQALAIWKGGMSFHGGLLGVFAALFFFARHYRVSLLVMVDLTAYVAPIGLFFGRIANFINGELYGRVTDVSWAVVFPNGGPSPRHPSQLYEAFLEGVVLFMIMLVLLRVRAWRYSGLVAGVFALGYGVARFTVEYWREPDAHLGLLSLGLSQGQWLSLPMIGVGVGLMIYALRRPPMPTR